MQVDLHLDITDDSGLCQSISVGTTDIAAAPSIATLGLSLADGKAFLSQLQTQVVSAQIAAINAQHRLCPVCQSQRSIKDYHQVNFRSLFGQVCARVSRFNPPSCQCPSGVEVPHKRQRQISAELEFVQSQLAATLTACRSWSTPFSGVCGTDEVAMPFESWKSCNWCWVDSMWSTKRP